PFFPAVPFTPVDGFVRTLDAIRLECWTGSDQNAGRHHLRTPGRLPLESAIGRLSGDEFAASLPLSDPDLSEATVVRIRELLAPKFVLPGAIIDVRFSIGYVVGGAGDDSI